MRRVRVGQLRLGMRLSSGAEVVELVRPDPSLVKRGYGRVWVGFDGVGGLSPDGVSCYPDVFLTLADDDDSPLDRTMDGWAGRWWPIEEA